MKVALGSDHRGVDLKLGLQARLRNDGHECRDFGAYNSDPVDYPDIAAAVCNFVVTGECERGVLICGTGIGMSIAANKVSGVRAALCDSVFMATRARLHNDANVLVLGAEIVSLDAAAEIARIFMSTPFEGGRHQRRLDKLVVLDNA
jgi:ribose 5-phosphate isomerase B